MRFLVLLSAVSGVSFLGARATVYPDPEPCSGHCWSHDPCVVRRSSDGTYFRFETGSQIGIWKAPDLVGPWTYQGKAVPGGSIINLPGRDDLWAPAVHRVGSVYILYYSVSTFGSQNSAIGYALSPTMEVGTWVDRGSTGITSSSGKPYNAIDANLIQAESNYYMNYGSFWGDIFQVAMNADATETAGTSSYQIAFNATAPQALEGSFMYLRDGYYYLLFSSGVCCGYATNKPRPGEEYKIFVCRSATVNGPFLDKSGKSCLSSGGTLLLGSHGYVYGPGGQGILEDPVRGSVLYYHYANMNIGLADSEYQFGWNVLQWSDGWPYV